MKLDPYNNPEEQPIDEEDVVVVTEDGSPIFPIEYFEEQFDPSKETLEARIRE
jgi:hypothetical protein